MIPATFTYHKPASLADALSLLCDAGGDGLLLAGGHSLIPMMKMRLAAPACLVDLNGIGELRGIHTDTAKGEIVIGALTTQHALIDSAALAAVCPLLRETAKQIADPQVRYCGTIGGNAANGDPGNDMPAVLQCLNATFVLRGKDGEHRIAARDYYLGAYDTARTDGQILIAIHIPTPAAGHGFAYEKQKRKVGDYATAAAAVVLSRQKGIITAADIALTNLADTPLLATEAAACLQGSEGGDAIIKQAAEKAAAICDPADDNRGPPAFRRALAAVMTERAIHSALTRAAA